MGKVTFFSFKEDDRHYVAKVKGRAVNPFYYSLDFRVRDLLKRWNTEDSSVIRQAISKKLLGTSRTIVFIGPNTHNSYWVEQEVEMTINSGKPVFAIRLPYANFATTPPVLRNNDIVPLYWSEDNLQFLATKVITQSDLRVFQKGSSFWSFLGGHA
jgi:hypothetical protein